MGKPLPYLFFITLLYSCTTPETTELTFLEGTWKVEGKEQYEVWEWNKPGLLQGYGYIIKKEEKEITETIAIKKVDGQWFFEATVPDQNEGATIPFALNQSIDTLLSFENAAHDFPKKVQYQLLEDGRIKVNVLGEEGRGFSYIQVRTKR